MNTRCLGELDPSRHFREDGAGFLDHFLIKNIFMPISPTFSTLMLFPKVNHERLTWNQEGLGDVIKIFLMRK